MQIIAMIMMGFVMYTFIAAVFYWTMLYFTYKSFDSNLTFKDWLNYPVQQHPYIHMPSEEESCRMVVRIASFIWPIAIVFLILYNVVTAIVKVIGILFNKILRGMNEKEANKKA